MYVPLDWKVVDKAGHVHEADTRFGVFKVYRHPDAKKIMVCHFLDKAYQCHSIKEGKGMMQHVYNTLLDKRSNYV